MTPTINENLWRLYMQADALDHADGRTAYIKYHDLLLRLSIHYGFEFEPTVAAFAALSPNNDYLGNLRSLVSLLCCRTSISATSLFTRTGMERATVSTYKACAKRAISYLLDGVSFTETVKGQKITAFYHNILDPTCSRHVTIDGHMIGAYLAQPLTMKEAQKWMTRTRYIEVARAVQALARQADMLPHQMQAILWMTRKRVLGVKYTPQFDLFNAQGEGQPITFSVETIKPYPEQRRAA